MKLKRFYFVFVFFVILLFSNINYSFAGNITTDSINFEDELITTISEWQMKLVNDNQMLKYIDSMEVVLGLGNSNVTKDSDYNFHRDSIPEYNDSVYYQRIMDMNAETPFNFTYNQQVKRIINFYIKYKSNLTERALGLSKLYFPIFEEQLIKHNLPVELKYLPIVESALNPTAKSSAGAAGLWQFMYNTGKIYGLNVTSFVDERFDPYQSTEAACLHLKHLYKLFGDWNLAIAAYNVGQGNLAKAIRRSGGSKDFWVLSKYLPRETRWYVPSFIAVNYLMNYSTEHNIQAVKSEFNYFETDTVVVKKRITYDQISELLGVSVQSLKVLNPMFKSDVVPSNSKHHYTLILPKEYVGLYVLNEENLYNYKTKDQLLMEEYALKYNIKIINGELQNRHIVKNGETLGGIAVKYGCTVSKLKSWNNLRGVLIKPKQKLFVYVPMNMANMQSIVKRNKIAVNM